MDLYPVILEMTLVDTRSHKEVKAKTCQLTLMEDSLLDEYDYTCNSKNPNTDVFEEKHYQGMMRYKKDFVSGTECYFDIGEKMWCVNILIANSQPVHFYFKRAFKAINYWRLMNTWIFDRLTQQAIDDYQKETRSLKPGP